MEVVCGMNYTYPTELLNKCKQSWSSLVALALEQRHPGKTEIQTLACIHSLDNRPCVGRICQTMFSLLECLLVWLLPSLAQQMRSQTWKNASISKLLLIIVMGTKEQEWKRPTGGRHLEAISEYACVYIHTRRHAHTNALFPHFFVGGKKVHYAPTKNKGKSLLLNLWQKYEETSRKL